VSPSTPELDRLSKLLELTSSDYDGEALAAARAAHRFLRSLGLTWAELLGTPAAARPQPVRGPWRLTIEDCLARPGSLMPWQAKFLRSLREFPRISPKQRTVLDQIAERVLGRRAA
jgi:Protein of unknown function (DUF2786)